MKRIALLLLLLALAGCATERPYSGYGDEGGSYTLSGAGSGLRFAPGYDSLFLYGVYPWWTYDYYSPYFYPHRFSYYHPFYDPFWDPWPFAGWYPVWPYGRGYAWRSALYRPWPVYPAAPYHPVDPVPPAVPHPAPPAGRLIADEERRRAIDEYSLARERMNRGYGYGPGPVTGSSKPLPPKGHSATARPKTFIPPKTRSTGAFGPRARSGPSTGPGKAPSLPAPAGRPTGDGGSTRRER